MQLPMTLQQYECLLSDVFDMLPQLNIAYACYYHPTSLTMYQLLVRYTNLPLHRLLTTSCGLTKSVLLHVLSAFAVTDTDSLTDACLITFTGVRGHALLFLQDTLYQSFIGRYTIRRERMTKSSMSAMLSSFNRKTCRARSIIFQQLTGVPHWLPDDTKVNFKPLECWDVRPANIIAKAEELMQQARTPYTMLSRILNENRPMCLV